MYHVRIITYLEIPCHIVPYRAVGIQMPDVLTVTKELPMEWLSTGMYAKATNLLLRHTSTTRKTPQYHIVSHNEYLVLSVEGVDKYKKVDDKLVER